jgi:hypothetical protein
MFGRGSEKTYLGLKGFRLNVAIGLIAGLDFLYGCLFDCTSRIAYNRAGYLDMTSTPHGTRISVPCLIDVRGVMGGLLTLPSFVATFPEIDLTASGTKGLSQSQVNHKSTIQGATSLA